MRTILYFCMCLIVAWSAVGGLLALIHFYPWCGALATLIVVAGIVSAATDNALRD